jgi:hypothetical protein
MGRSVARPFQVANFGGILSYNAPVAMYFPAGIPLVALVALVIWNARQEAQRAQSASKPKAG